MHCEIFCLRPLRTFYVLTHTTYCILHNNNTVKKDFFLYIILKFRYCIYCQIFPTNVTFFSDACPSSEVIEHKFWICNAGVQKKKSYNFYLYTGDINLRHSVIKVMFKKKEVAVLS